MQRVVSGEGIHGLSKQYSSSDQIDKEQPTGDYLARNSSENNEAMMPHSPSTAFDGTANFVENDGEGYFEDEDDGGVTMDMDDTYATFTSEPSIAGSQLEPQQQQEEIRHISQRHYSGSPSRSISSNTGGSNSNSNDTHQRTATSTEDQHQQHTPMSIISGLLPTVGLPRNDSRNSGTTTSFGSGLQRSQNSSRDWGWFEDVHHSDQSVTGSTNSNGGGGGTTGSTRTGGNNKSERTTMGGSVASSGANRTSLPQHQLTYTRTGDIVHGIGTGTSNNGNERTNTGGQNSSGNHRIEGGDSANNNKNNWNNRLRPRGRGDNNTKAASLLPTGDEMLIDEMQEYLEPILIHPRPRDMENEAAVQAVTAPNYVLEESLSDQLLWKRTAGNRPPQPVEERAFFEAMWAENFAASEVNYRMPAEVLTATTPVSLNPFADGNFGTVGTGVIGAGGTPVAEVGGSGIGGANHQDVADIVSSFVVPGGTSEHGVASGQHNPHHHKCRHQIVRSNSGSGGDLIVYTKGDNVFGTTVSKSFARPSINGELVSGVDTVNISIASYRVVESEKRGKHAQFLVIYREGSIRDTIGVWKRYSDFQELSKKVTKVHEGCATVIVNMSPLAMTEEHDVEHLPNAITSWHLLKKRKRWYRCLDSGYLSLKAFLLERFLHDILFESSTPDLLREFVGVPPPR